MNTNDFDKIAPYYDQLAHLIFSDSIKKAQVEFLHHIKSRSKVLILGGGTGWILQEVLTIEKDIEIFYVEKSSKMLEIARSRLDSETPPNVRFIHSSMEEWKTDVDFDTVICNYFLDVFSEVKLQQQIIPKLKLLLKPGGKLLVADFQNKKNLLWQKLILWVMHVFFGKVSKLESKQLTNFETVLGRAGFDLEKERDFHRSMIFSHVYGLKG